MKHSDGNFEKKAHYAVKMVYCGGLVELSL